MVHVALTRKYRPQTFDEVVGQEHVTTTLKNAITQGRISHAYLFAGSRGVGKTTTARILAKALNCAEGPSPSPCGKCAICEEIANSTSVDVYEIDGASNRGIDEVRGLRENVKYAPSRGRYKIYIIDEVHMLTTEAFNALLKTLEEPPQHVVFILATTQPHKVVPTILSRCQRFDFRRLSDEDLLERIAFIAREEGIKIEKEAALLITRRADGSIRDAESILDQLASYSTNSIQKGDVISVLGICEPESYFELVDTFTKSDTKRSLEIVNEVAERGHDLHYFVVGLVEHLRVLLMVKLMAETGETRSLTKTERAKFEAQASSLYPEDIVRMLNIGCRLEVEMRKSIHPRSAVEATFVRLSRLGSSVSLHDLLRRIERLETLRGELTIDEVKGGWSRMVESVRSENPVLASQLEKAEVLELEGDRLMLGVSRALDRQMKEPHLDDRLGDVERLFAEQFGRQVKIHILAEEGSAEPARSRSMDETIVKKVFEIFNGEIDEGR